MCKHSSRSRAASGVLDANEARAQFAAPGAAILLDGASHQAARR